jgi:two-component system sensor histidine kinase KdpD
MAEEERSGTNRRPSPEALLAEAQREARGRLKIFLGAAPGVGKTYEMLTSARRLARDGTDVVVGLVETHGRHETAALLAGLEVLPRRRVAHRGHELEEMDLDALLRRRPALALVDELAHDNAPGSRHPKRWMDVEELLASGIDVWTTMNVQHVESLNDVVAQITHVRVRETVPDSVLARAEIELIDLTPDELRQRLHDGKVYVPEAASRALEHYFNHGNLTALRELALRRTAERVDDRMVQYMRAHGLAGPWAAGDRLLACVHAGEGAAEIVRYTKRLADRLRAPWTAIHVQTAADRRAGDVAHDRVADTLRLAERLGGETLVLPGEAVAEEILTWARANNVTQIVIGSVRRSGWRDWLAGSLPRDLIRGASDIIVQVLPEGGETAAPKRVRARAPERRPALLPYLGAALLVALATGAGWLLQDLLDLSNVALVFVLPVLATALAAGLGPALAASILSVLAYNFFFTDPLYTFRIADPENVAGLILFSLVAAIASGIAARTRAQTLVARQEAARAGALYAFAKKLTGVATMDDLLWAAAHQVALMLKVEVVFLLPEDEGALAVQAAYPPEDRIDANNLAAAEWCWRNDTPAGRGSDNLPGAPRLFLPLRTGRGKLGVVGIRRNLAGPLLTPAERRLLDALLDQTALAIDRAQLARDVDASRLLAETERLRTALLTSVGHDLKTPLASILGAISALRSNRAGYDDATRGELLATAQDEAERLARFVDNLLDMTRLEAGALGPKREPVDLADAVGSALRRTSRLLAGHRVTTDLPEDLPLLRGDFVLLEQVLVNLLENAARYTPAGTEVEIGARHGGRALVVEVRDRGPGIAPDDAQRIFDRFYRVQGSAPGKGVGLGLAVVKGFVEAMGGRVSVVERSGGGAVFRLAFPNDLVVVPVDAEAVLAP